MCGRRAMQSAGACIGVRLAGLGEDGGWVSGWAQAASKRRRASLIHSLS